MAQEYTIKTFEPWDDRDNGGFVRDQHGNYKGTVTFEEDNSEPIDATFKTIPEAGAKKYGTVEDYQTKAGKYRKRFKSASRPDFQNAGNGNSHAAGSKGNTWQPRDDAAIQAQFSIGHVIDNFGTPIREMNDTDWADVENASKKVFTMIDRVKNSNTSPVDKVANEQEPWPIEPEDLNDNGSFGYKNNEEINLDDIPF